MGYQHQQRTKAPLIRDPAEWARESGWISPRKARNDAQRLRDMAEKIRGALGEDDNTWAHECERIANRLDPSRVAAMREP